jgi:saccharopine dehydrogenase (NAD+, L-lysine-forming)
MLKCWIAQQHGTICGAVSAYPDKHHLLDKLRTQMDAM